MALVPAEFEDVHIEYGQVDVSKGAGWNSESITFDRAYTNAPKMFVSFHSSSAANMLQYTPFSNGISTTGANIQLYNSGSAATGTYKVDWLAVGV